MLHSCTPWKRQKTQVFWRFQGVQKCNIGRIWVNQNHMTITSKSVKTAKLDYKVSSDKHQVVISEVTKFITS